MRLSKALPAWLLILTLVNVAACARNARVEGDPNPGYTLLVRNRLTTPMLIAYEDGTGARVLGTVLASSDERFIIVKPSRTDISVTAANQDRTITRSFPVTLVAGTSTEVTVR